jgi:two-component system chemotaxis response regulator CheY
MKHILVVDDSKTTRSFIKSVIEPLGEVNVVGAVSGFEALRILPQHPFDLILTDINMPDINGFEFMNFIKGNEKYKNIPVVFVSTEQSEDDIVKGKSLGAVDYITKPFMPEELQIIVKRILNI